MVIDIKVPERFRGRHTSYQDDIALVFLASPLQYDFNIRPVCIDFGIILEKAVGCRQFGKMVAYGRDTPARRQPQPQTRHHRVVAPWGVG
ncbi:hypothetical protein EVAR_46156_1 [Eumeta japonica]|uniref:Uncharacterized protein n=1 Tax=Eumeta variegata TaxID=151549 RepID=A0A4C2ADQ8_EUMVA|nr:hypothetical protein EVAR_46156_1 [Eumeta japonica]